MNMTRYNKRIDFFDASAKGKGDSIDSPVVHIISSFIKTPLPLLETSDCLSDPDTREHNTPAGRRNQNILTIEEKRLILSV